MHRPMMSGMIVHARIVAVKLARFRPISMDARVRFPMRRRDLRGQRRSYMKSWCLLICEREVL
jgi:hypothetical protein